MHPYDRAARLLLPGGAVAVLATVLGVGWFTQPDRFSRGFAPAQPIPFSHQLHAGQMQIQCLYCHSGAARSRVAGVPAADTCMNCHKVTKVDSPDIKRLTAAWQSGEPIVWQRIHRLPQHVFFDHRPHVAAGIACQTCHGQVQDMERVSQQMSMRMSNCLGCHRDPHAALPADSPIQRGAENCGACHR
jgi:hypothetical protein